MSKDTRDTSEYNTILLTPEPTVKKRRVQENSCEMETDDNQTSTIIRPNRDATLDASNQINITGSAGPLKTPVTTRSAPTKRPRGRPKKTVICSPPRWEREFNSLRKDVNQLASNMESMMRQLLTLNLSLNHSQRDQSNNNPFVRPIINDDNVPTTVSDDDNDNGENVVDNNDDLEDQYSILSQPQIRKSKRDIDVISAYTKDEDYDTDATFGKTYQIRRDPEPSNVLMKEENIFKIQTMIKPFKGDNWMGWLRILELTFDKMNIHSDSDRLYLLNTKLDYKILEENDKAISRCKSYMDLRNLLTKQYSNKSTIKSAEIELKALEVMKLNDHKDIDKVARKANHLLRTAYSFMEDTQRYKRVAEILGSKLPMQAQLMIVGHSPTSLEDVICFIKDLYQKSNQHTLRNNRPSNNAHKNNRIDKKHDNKDPYNKPSFKGDIKKSDYTKPDSKTSNFKSKAKKPAHFVQYNSGNENEYMNKKHTQCYNVTSSSDSAENLDYDVILGTNLLRTLNIWLNLASGELKCGNPNTDATYLTLVHNTDKEILKIVDTLYNEFKNAFSTNDMDIGKCTIIAQPQTFRPIETMNKRAPYYETPLHSQPDALALAQQFVDCGILSPNMGIIVHPVLLVKKPSGKFRFVSDLRKVNSIVDMIDARITSPLTLLSSLRTFVYLSQFDLVSGFHQVHLQEKEKSYYGIKIGEHYFTYNTLVQGGRNSSIQFVNVMHQVYSTINDLSHSKLYIYIDDLILITFTNREDHITALKLFLDLTISAGLKLSPEKTTMLSTETIFLGNHITCSHRKIDNSHITKLLNNKKPETPSQLLSFLQSIQFYREYFRSIQVDIAELYKYTTTNRSCKNKKLVMPTSAWKHYDNILNELKNNSGLHLFIPGYPIELHVDASSYGIGSMLCQRVPAHIGYPDEYDETDSKEVLIPLSFYSKSLPPTVNGRCSTYTELFAIHRSVRYWSYILTNVEFSVFSDHKPLLHLRMSTSIHKFVEMITELEGFNFTIYHVPGEHNTFPDYLSRIRSPPPKTLESCTLKDINKSPTHKEPILNLLIQFHKYLHSKEFSQYQENDLLLMELYKKKQFGRMKVRKDKFDNTLKILAFVKGVDNGEAWLPLITWSQLEKIFPGLDGSIITFLTEFAYIIQDKKVKDVYKDKQVKEVFNIMNLTPLKINELSRLELKSHYSDDEWLKKVIDSKEMKYRNFKVVHKDGLYFAIDTSSCDNEELLLYIPEKLETRLFDMVHKESNHPNYDKMRILLKSIFIPKKCKKICDYLKKCKACLSRNIIPNSDKLIQRPMKMENVYETLSFDYMGPIESDKRNRKHVLVVICNASTFIWLFPMVSTGSQELLKKLNKLFTVFGRPKRIHRDCSKGNTSKEVEDYLKSWGIESSTSIPHYSRSNALVERKIRDIQAILSKKLMDYKMSKCLVTWSDLLPEVMYQANVTPILRTDITPFQLMFGRIGRNNLDLFLKSFSPYVNNKADEILQGSKIAIDIVREQQKESRNRQLERINKNRVPTIEVKKYQIVYLKNENERKGKLEPNYFGPYFVREIHKDFAIIHKVDGKGQDIKAHLRSLKLTSDYLDPSSAKIRLNKGGITHTYI
uniref:RNA-directed DNA polymerase n=1 Tax=Parastrongyloides trichosuri TaxID=131310 RepID=A0A0N4ZGQ5_PARTI